MTCRLASDGGKSKNSYLKETVVLKCILLHREFLSSGPDICIMCTACCSILWDKYLLTVVALAYVGVAIEN